MLTKTDKFLKFLKRALNATKVSRRGRATPVFIFGEMRSGTNMLTDCLTRSLATEVFNENDDEAFDGYALRGNDRLAHLIDRSTATHVVFKALADSARATELLDTFAQSKGIWIYRQFTDVVNSALRKWSEHNEYLRFVLHEPERAGWRRTNLSDQSMELIRHHYERGLSESSARALIWYVRNSLFFEQGLDRKANVMLLNYEDLVTQPNLHVKAVFEFIGVRFRDRYVKQVSTRSIGKDAVPEIDGAVLQLCQSMMQRLNSLWKASSDMEHSVGEVA